MTLAPDLPPCGRFDGPVHRYPLRVYHEDTDRSGVVYHANYLRWLERARTEMLRLAGIDHAGAVGKGGGGYAVADLAIRYLAPARLDDAILVASSVAALGAARVELDQEVRRGDALLARARVTAAFVDPDGRPRRQPREWIARMRPLAPPSVTEER